MAPRLSLSVSLVAMLLGAFGRPASAQEPPRLLMQDVQPKGVEPAVAQALTDLLEIEIERGRLFSLVSQQDLRTLLQVEEQRILFGIEDGQEERMAAIARKVDAPFALAASVGKLGGAYLLSLRLFDVDKAEVVRRVSQTLVGDEAGLAGSLRAAVLALTLQEKGLERDLSEELIDGLKIATEPKSFFLTVSLESSFPLSGSVSAESTLTFNPSYYGFGLCAELPIAAWLRAFASFGFGNTINGHGRFEQLTAGSLTLADDSVQPSLTATTTSLDYTSWSIPLLLGVKLVPDQGRFLPYALVGVGASLTQLQFDPGTLQSTFRDSQSMAACPAPYAIEDRGDHQECFYQVALEAADDIFAVGFDLVAAVGLEWLLAHHFGITLDVRYHFNYLPGAVEDFRVPYRGTIASDSDPTWKQYESATLLAVQQENHLLQFSVGALFYW
jgi:hypothetical protein